MAKPPRRRHSVAEMRANPNWRRYLKDAQLTPGQRASRTRNTALKADPLAPVTSMRDLEGQASTLVDTQQAGDTAAIKAEQDRANAEFGTRSQLYQGLGAMQTQGYQNAFQDTTAALNNLISTSNAGSAEDQGNLAAALRQADAEQAKAYAAAGAPGPPPPTGQNDNTAARLAALAGTTEAARGQVAQTGAAQIGAAGAMRAIPGQQLALNLASLTGERNQTNRELQGKRDTLTQNRHGLLRQAVRDLQDFEVAKRQFGDQHGNMLFQQYMAEKEFDEKVKQEGFAQWLQTSQLTGTTAPGGPVAAGRSTIPGRAQTTAERVAGSQITGRDPRTGRETVDARNQRLTRGIDWFNARTNRAQAEASIQAAFQEADQAKTKEQKDKAVDRAQAIGKGISALDSYLAPVGGEGAPPSSNSRFPRGESTVLTDKNGKPVMRDNPKAGQLDPRTGNPQPDKIPATGRPYVRTYQGALSHLRSQGLSMSDALRVLSMSSFTDWSAKAKHELGRLKRRKRGQADDLPSGTPKPGGSGAAGYGGPT